MKLNWEKYTVGWISALPREHAAVYFDEQHENLPARGGNSPAYTLGKMGHHNVVLACLPEGSMGSNPAARVVALLENSFKSLRFIVLVGVAGGAPSTKRDVRLGDIVVGVPGKKSGAVVQYDYGTNLQDEHLDVRATHMGPPDETLLGAVTQLMSEQKQSSGGSAVSQRLIAFVNQKAAASPGMKGSRRPPEDLLFPADYVHADDAANCSSCCDPARVVTWRKARNPSGIFGMPTIHRGVIGSGNEVVRNATDRDRVADAHDLLCFEMEAAGLRTRLGWLAIRGICDYCDTHKNKDWQDHAALVAAAFAREVLARVPASDESEEKGKQAETGGLRQKMTYQGPISVSNGRFYGGNNIGGNSSIIYNN